MTTSSIKRTMGVHRPFPITSVDGNRWQSMALVSFESIPNRQTPTPSRQSPAFRRKLPRGFSPVYRPTPPVPGPEGPRLLPAEAGTPTLHLSLTQPRRSPAFTLIELLIVVMIIAILFSIILSAIRTVERHTLQTVTQAEIKNIETAWKQYFAHYQMWPTSATNATSLLDEKLTNILIGSPDDDDEELNPDQIIFMEFTRFAEDEGETIPLNAWGESGRHKAEDCAYYVMFDGDGDNLLEFSPGSGYTSTNIYRSVIVWSFNPAQMEEENGDGSDKPKLLGSWMQ